MQQTHECVKINVTLIIPSTELSNSNNRVFILTYYMIPPYFWVIFRWYTPLTINYQNLHSNRRWIPSS
jgi:hypothetical protein